MLCILEAGELLRSVVLAEDIVKPLYLNVETMSSERSTTYLFWTQIKCRRHNNNLCRSVKVVKGCNKRLFTEFTTPSLKQNKYALHNFTPESS